MGGISEPVSLAAARAAPIGLVGGVGLRRGGEMDAGLRQRQLAFGRAEPLIGRGGRVAHQQRLGIGEADILDGDADQAAGDEERILAALQHAGEPVERRIGIGAAHRLVPGGDEIVVLLADPCRRRARASAAAAIRALASSGGSRPQAKTSSSRLRK